MIRDWAPEDRPREKLMQFGAAALTNVELLAILLRTGCDGATVMDVARSLLAAQENDLLVLMRSSPEKMMHIRGMGKTKAITLSAAFELGRRCQFRPPKTGPVTSARDVAELMIPILKDLTYETCWVLFFDGGRHYIGKEQISSGGLNATIVDVRMVLKTALDKLACEMILVHNHPSGNTNPGRQDKLLTQSLKNAAKMVDVALIDHVVIGGDGYFSFAEEGIL